MILHFEQLYTPDKILINHALECENGYIKGIVDSNSSSIKAEQSYPIGCAGFVDIQVNGGGGVLFNQEPCVDTLETMYKAHLQHGTCSMLPTIITDNAATMQMAADAVAAYRSQSLRHQLNIAGIHFEGPWLAKKRKGVHPEQFIRTPTQVELSLLRRSDLGVVKVTLAPEQVKPEIIKELVDDGIVVFLGHSDASIEQVERALHAGASGFTHLYNAMSPMQSRAPGMVGAALSHENSYAGIIVDGYHVDPACIKAAYHAKGPEKLALVTDAMALAVSELDSMAFFDQMITKVDNKLTIADGTLAGSCLSMLAAVKNIINFCNVPLADAFKMASSTPTSAIGLSKSLGQIAPNMPANILGLDHNLDIALICHHGKCIDIT